MVLLPLLLAAASAPLPSGWWIVDSANGTDVGLPGAAWEFGAEVFTVDADRTSLRHTPLRCRATSDHSWHCERTLPSGVHYLTLRLGRDGALAGSVGREGQDPYGAFNARPASPGEGRGLDAFAKQALAADAGDCARAKRCYAVACPAFGDAADPCIFEKQSMSRDGPSCRTFLPMLVSTLRSLDKPIPPECR